VRVLLIDADSEAFAASAACDAKRYLGTREEFPGIHVGPFSTKKELTNSDLSGPITAWENVTTKPVEQAQINLDARLRRIIHATEQRYGKVSVELYLSGKVNYRHLVDPSYKWSRDRTVRPYHFHAVRQWAVDQWGARVCPTWEADDEIGIRATELGPEGFILASLDKDLRQVPGNHLVLEQSGVKGHLEVTERGGLMRLYSQILKGDPVDNIPGCYMIGDKKAFDLLEPVVDLGELAMWQVVVQAYEASILKYGRDKCGYIDGEAQARHTAQLVYILRNRPAGPIPPRWVPPDVERPTSDEVADLEGT
jgi:hypothetical protein